MRCPNCQGDLETITLLTGGGTVESRRCPQCGGFWFEKGEEEKVSSESVKNFDIAAPNYSLKTNDFICPNDGTLMAEEEIDNGPAGIKYWRCPDCDGTFFPKGQLALVTSHRDLEGRTEVSVGLLTHNQITQVAVLLGLGI